MGGAVLPPCCLFGLTCPSTEVYQLLGGTRSWGGNISLQEGSHQWVLPRTTTVSVFVPAVGHSCPPSPQKTFQYEQAGLAQSPMRSLLFSLGPGVQKTLCAPSKSGVSVSSSPVEFLQSNPAGLQSQILWGLPLLLSDSQAEKPDVGLRICTPVGELLWYNYFQVCGPAGMGFDFITIAPLVSSRCGFFFVFGWRVSFLIGSSILLSMVLQQLWFWCFHKKGWAHVLLLHHLETSSLSALWFICWHYMSVPPSGLWAPQMHEPWNLSFKAQKVLILVNSNLPIFFSFFMLLV